LGSSAERLGIVAEKSQQKKKEKKETPGKSRGERSMDEREKVETKVTC
jgi:hypothetical protein